MALDPRTRKPRRTLVALVVVLLALMGGIAASKIWSDGQLTPKLGLDLEGGTELVLTPVLSNGQTVSSGQVDKARDIIEQRVNGYGVSEAEVSVQGGQNIDVSIPGTPSAATLDAIRKPSQLRFRPVLAEDSGIPVPTSTATGTATGTSTAKPTGTATSTAKPTTTTPGPVFTTDAPATSSAPATSANAAIPQALTKATTTPTPSATAASTPASTATATAAASSTPTTTPTDASDPAWITAAVEAQFTALDCSKPDAASSAQDDPSKPLVTCSTDRSTKYVLGPVELDGTAISNATAGYQTSQNGQPTNVVEVALTFNSEGTSKFASVTSRLLPLPSPRNQFAIVLDKQVISAPVSQAAITDGRASITGGFTIDSAQALAQQLKYGALPLSFQLQTQDDVSPTLGTEQLKLGLIAGLIGLILVVGYSLLQYRLLGLVTVASLVVAAAITYGTLTFLGWAYGFRLTLAGVTGVIVSIGVTADSFIVYFERVRDEVREGRPLVAAVEAGWKRARRTILAADGVNFLAAVVLYILAASSVRGFAFTLGVTTVIDLVVVMLFTHPVVALLARTRFFGGGHPWSGLDPTRLGAKARYVGRGQFSGPRTATGKAAPSSRAAADDVDDEADVDDDALETATAGSSRTSAPSRKG